MKILWICNIMLPFIAKKIEVEEPVVGGWLTGILDALKKSEGIDLMICFPFPNQIYGEIGKIKYCSFTQSHKFKYEPKNELEFTNILKKENPDIIHIFGTEFPHSLAAVNAAINAKVLDRTVISIQGIISMCARHYFSAK